MSRELFIHTHFSGEVGHIEIFAPALDQAILVKLIDGDHLMGAGLAKNDRCIGALLHHHPIVRKDVDDVALVVRGDADLKLDLFTQCLLALHYRTARHPKSEERRVGKECVSTCKLEVCADTKKKKK